MNKFMHIAGIVLFSIFGITSFVGVLLGRTQHLLIFFWSILLVWALIDELKK